MSRHVVATVEEVAPGDEQARQVKGREIGVFNVDGDFYALANRCPHEGGSLCARQDLRTGEVRRSESKHSIERKGEFLRCPWHGWEEFDIRTGQSYCDPNNVKIRQFQIAVEPGEEIWSKGHTSPSHSRVGGKELRRRRGVTQRQRQDSGSSPGLTR